MKLIIGKYANSEFSCIDEIMGEIINIMFNTTYYKNGILLDKKKSKHNTYMINNVKYEISPNIILIAIPISATAKYANLLFNKLTSIRDKFILDVKKKWGDTLNKTSSSGTTHYMVFNTNELITIQYVVINDLNDISKRKDDSQIIVYIYEGSIPVSGLTKGDMNSIYSLSTIVVSLENEFKLINGYTSPDFPSFSDYKLADKLIIKPIKFDINIGLHGEIYKHFDGYKYSIGMQTNYEINNIKLVPFEWLNIYSNNFNGKTPTQLIKNGIFEAPPAKPNYKCFMTGCPIFDDCYVFDFYECANNSHNKTIYYNTPKCVLVSPYYMHLVNDVENNFIKFKHDCGAKFLIYRTKCPHTLTDILNDKSAKLDTNVKTILLDIYNYAAIDACDHIKCNNTYLYIKSKSTTNSYLLCNYGGKLFGYFY